jgi:HPt (histidine-containing phosphotransfer) domain-containing protein
MQPGQDAQAFDAELAARLALLNERFAAALPQTLASLLAARNAFDLMQPQADLIELCHKTLHKLAGSSATFGFGRLGQAARTLEHRLCVLATCDACAPCDWENWLAALELFIEWAGRDPKSAYPDDEPAV